MSRQIVQPLAAGVPAGGATSQVLMKTSATDFAASWQTPASYLTQAQADTRYLQLTGGTLTGMLTLSADPSTALQAATKQYADTKQTQAQADARYLQLTGGTLSGNLLFSPDNTVDIGASGATRPRDLYVGRNGYVSGTLLVASTVTASSFVVGGSGTPPVIKNPASSATSLSIESQNISNIGGKVGANLMGNVYWDGSNFNRYDVAQPTMRAYAITNEFAVQYAPAGANPVSWSTALRIDSAGKVTLPAGTAQALLTQTFTGIDYTVSGSGWQQTTATATFTVSASGMTVRIEYTATLTNRTGASGIPIGIGLDGSLKWPNVAFMNIGAANEIYTASGVVYEGAMTPGSHTLAIWLYGTNVGFHSQGWTGFAVTEQRC